MEQDLMTSAELDSINAAQVVQEFDDMVTLDEMGDDRGRDRLESIAEELRIEFDDERQVEYAFMLIREAHRL